MYRYSVDDSIVYTSEDVVLYKESPFACWMERLTLENPDHGIAPDVGMESPPVGPRPQDDLARTLRSEGKHVALIDWQVTEQVRRSATWEAMKEGVDFIVNGHLSVGPLAATADLLMRTSGYSELGNHLYLPADTHAKTTLHSAFRLCFLADLLHSMQGQLPPQMVILRPGADVVPLQTEDHIYHFLAVKRRFMESMRSFRKHRMPDPSESAHFGRWSDCGNAVIKERALDGEPALSEATMDEPEYQVQAATAPSAMVGATAEAVAVVEGPYDLDDQQVSEHAEAIGAAEVTPEARLAPTPTLKNSETAAPSQATGTADAYDRDLAGFNAAEKFVEGRARRVSDRIAELQETEDQGEAASSPTIDPMALQLIPNDMVDSDTVSPRRSNRFATPDYAAAENGDLTDLGLPEYKPPLSSVLSTADDDLEGDPMLSESSRQEESMTESPAIVQNFDASEIGGEPSGAVHGAGHGSIDHAMHEAEETAHERAAPSVPNSKPDLSAENPEEPDGEADDSGLPMFSEAPPFSETLFTNIEPET